MKESSNHHTEPIDFVVLWVDPNDPSWQEEKKKYRPSSNEDVKQIRYQDWNNFRYWFRAIERYAPWVNKIHVVTCGQIPLWLNRDHPKIHLVSHKDYMPQDALPVFNSSAIEVGIHKIEGLSDHFVFFNDDMFITSAITPGYYFLNDLPIDMAGLTRKVVFNEKNVFGSILSNNIQIINKYFSFYSVLLRNWRKWFRLSYGKTLLRTVLNLCNRQFPGFVIPHLSVPYTKKNFERVWELEEDMLIETQFHRFRSPYDLSHFIFRYYRLCEGVFIPRASKGRYYSINSADDAEKAAKAILEERYPEICINETCTDKVFEKAREIINEAFDMKFPTCSSFEI